MLISEAKKVGYKYSLLISKNFLKPQYYKISRLLLFFITRNKKKYQLLFFFILTCILLSSVPKVLIKKKRIKTEFLGFFYKKGLSFLYNFLLVYIPGLYYIFEKGSNYFNNESYVIFNSIPFIYEVDVLCEKNSDFMDYFLDYRIVFFFKFSTINKKSSESELRCIYKWPVFFN